MDDGFDLWEKHILEKNIDTILNLYKFGGVFSSNTKFGEENSIRCISHRL